MLFVFFAAAGCEKFVEPDAPATSVNEENVYKSDATAIAVLTGIYARMATNGLFTGSGGISFLSGLSADELTLAGVVTENRLIAYYRNELRTTPNENYGIDVWRDIFYYIFQSNAAIERVGNATTLSASVKQQLLGEARFMRAFFYFYLVNLVGEAPLVLTTEAAINAVLPRSPVPVVYQQIVADLKEAQQLLSENYLNKDLQIYAGTPERVRPTKWAATALLARTYLYLADYANAETEASKIIDNNPRFSLPALNNVFLKNSDEAIWQLQPVQAARNTEDAFTFTLPVTGPNATANPVYLSPQTLHAFEPGDGRRKGGNWIDSVIVSGTNYFYPAKYKATTASGAASEYLMVFRLAELYLVRAEARAQQNNIGDARDDLNTIRTRAGLPGTKANDKASLVTAVLNERQVEFFTEWGHRWLDLKRTGNVGAIMSVVTPLKANGRAWQSYQQWYPVLYNDILLNPRLSQNSGYQTP
ncbi:RagB/SusD family nutrient uptake outer membrane protein [Niastella populi]|nr:RagB/SusD family nutrient uptake outer membrane protein [Niastella populi]